MYLPSFGKLLNCQSTLLLSGETEKGQHPYLSISLINILNIYFGLCVLALCLKLNNDPFLSKIEKNNTD